MAKANKAKDIPVLGTDAEQVVWEFVPKWRSTCMVWNYKLTTKSAYVAVFAPKHALSAL